MSDFVFVNAPKAENALWPELERSYELRAQILERSEGLDAISQSLIQDVVFELQEIELAHADRHELQPPNEEALARVKSLNAQLADWLGQSDVSEPS